MTVTRVIRYTTKPECADDNERLIRDVFSELATAKPAGLRYTAVRLQDGISFIHIATIAGDVNPLTSSAAFKQFQDGIAERCAEGPTPAEATMIGSYPAP
jgi:hypothetical protein